MKYYHEKNGIFIACKKQEKLLYKAANLRYKRNEVFNEHGSFVFGVAQAPLAAIEKTKNIAIFKRLWNR